MYRFNRNEVRWGNNVSKDYFYSTQGTKQGGVLSGPIFLQYTNFLNERLSKKPSISLVVFTGKKVKKVIKKTPFLQRKGVVYTLKKMGSIELLAEFESVNKFEEGFISYQRSFDKSMLMIYSQLASKKDDNERVHALVFDKEMNLNIIF